jgi:putative FmdB family regulatory protein
MPTYVYRCTGCSTVMEVQHAIGETPYPHECGWDLVRVFTPTAVAFKGSGFYSTDKGDSGSK